MAKAETYNFSKRAKDDAEAFSGQFTMEIPETIEEAIEMWGADVVLSKATQSIIIDGQGIARRVAEQGDAEKVQTTINAWTPGVAANRSSGTSNAALMRQLKALKQADPGKHAEVMEMLNKQEAAVADADLTDSASA